MKYEHMILCLIIPSPDNPGPQLNVMMQPLIEELKYTTVTRRMNLTSGHHTYGQSMISWHMVFSLDGAFMEI
jgi:hypothetical protein